MDYLLQRKIRRFIRDNRQYLTRQQLKTIDGQVKSGDLNGALKGIEKILKKAVQIW